VKTEEQNESGKHSQFINPTICLKQEQFTEDLLLFCIFLFLLKPNPHKPILDSQCMCLHILGEAE